jgi:hypothetical protein
VIASLGETLRIPIIPKDCRGAARMGMHNKKRATLSQASTKLGQGSGEPVLTAQNIKGVVIQVLYGLRIGGVSLKLTRHCNDRTVQGRVPLSGE